MFTLGKSLYIMKFIFSLVLILYLNFGFSQVDTTTIVYKPIGVFHTDYNPSLPTPRQGVLVPDDMATIEIYEEYRGGLKTLDLFEYIIVLYHFNEADGWEPIVSPPGSNNDHEYGLFSTRIPKRPNPIGFSIIKLHKIKDGILYVSGVDAFDKTPVLDIKPYLPSVDCVKSIQNELIEEVLGHHDEIFIKDSVYFK